MLRPLADIKLEPASGKVTPPCLATVTVERNRRPP